jgi:hypothetical protein
MDAITIGAVLLAIVGGAAGQVGGQLWVGVEKLVRRPFSRGREDSNGGDGVSELTALKRAPDDEDKALALGEALLARAETDVAFRRALEGWWEQAAVIRSRQGPANNSMSVRTNYGGLSKTLVITSLHTITRDVQKAGDTPHRVIGNGFSSR